tara:strand:+ start:1486 stop:1704 length:219 start_codon:yes stop_codon:yes gene_type:complete
MNYNHATSITNGVTSASGSYHSFVYGSDGEVNVTMKGSDNAVTFRGTVGQQIHMNYTVVNGALTGVTGIALS